MRSLKSQLDAVKESQKRGFSVETINHNDEEVEEVNALEVEQEEYLGEKFIKVLSKMKGRSNMEVSTYSTSLKLEELIDWIREMEKYFDMEHIEDTKRVKVVCLKFQGHASLWWENVQNEKVKNRSLRYL